MTGIRTAKKNKTRHAILQAAIRLFGEKGVDNTSIEELAAAAEIGKGTIYGYYQTKDQIFLAFCEEEIDYAFSVLQEHTDPDAPILEQLMTLFMSQFRFVTENSEFGRHMVREMAFPKAAVSAASKELEKRYLGAIGEILEKAKARNELRRDCDSFLATGHFYGLYLVALSGWYTGYLRDHDEVEKSLRAIFVQALEGLGKASEK
jgi:AcrR family transcriptional regulator